MLTELILVGLDGFCWFSFPRNAIKLGRDWILGGCLFSLSLLLEGLQSELIIMDRSSPVLEFFIVMILWEIQSFYSLDQVKQFILLSGSVPEKGTNEFSSYLYNTPYKVEYILSPDPSTLSDYFTTTMLDISPSRAWLLIISPFGTKPYICIESYFSTSENKPR